MKILVTGGAGFIGSAVVRYLLDQQKVGVINVDKLTYAGNLDSLGSVPQSRFYTFERLDICDADCMHRAFHVYRPDAVIHLAAESHVDRSIDSPSAFVATNVVGTFVLLQATLEYVRALDSESAGRFRFLHVSTDEVYGDLGDGGVSFSERTPYSPSSPYAASKAGADHLVRAWGKTYGLPILITNCSNNYGPCQFPEKLIPHMILSALASKPLPVYGEGRNVRDWLYVEDHAEALWTVLTEGHVGESYNIGGDNQRRNIDVVHKVCDLLEEMAPEAAAAGRFRDLITFVPDRPGHDTRYAIDSSKIERELGWKPRETFESGLEKTVRWYLDNRAWWTRILDRRYKLERLGEAKRANES